MCSVKPFPSLLFLVALSSVGCSVETRTGESGAVQDLTSSTSVPAAEEVARRVVDFLPESGYSGKTSEGRRCEVAIDWIEEDANVFVSIHTFGTDLPPPFEFEVHPLISGGGIGSDQPATPITDVIDASDSLSFKVDFRDTLGRPSSAAVLLSTNTGDGLSIKVVGSVRTIQCGGLVGA